MDKVSNLTDQFTDATRDLWDAVGDFLPKLVGALLLVLVALIVARIAQALVERVLQLVRVDQLLKNKQVAKTLQSAEVNIDVVSIAGRLVFWIVIVIFALTIADVLGLTAMRDVIREILGYLPSVLAAVIVLTVTVAGARLVRDIVVASLARMQITYARSIGAVAFYVLLLFGSIMALDQLGFDTTILTANITVIIAGIVLALSLAFGLGGRDAAKKVVDEAYNNYKKSIHK